MNVKQHLTLLLLCICTASGYPSKPLNDRPGDLAWQAWLLVDSQNNPAETDRRITPKSVFIAPKLGLDNGSSLPDCADGYRSDPMGRCIKFVKVDEAAHLDFLLERLNAMYATKSSAEDVDDDVQPTSGPLQVNIPFGLGFQSSAEEPAAPEPEIAIIVAPTNGNFDVEDTEAKVNVKRTHEEAADEQQDPTMPTTVEETTTTTTESVTETTTFETPTTTMNVDDLQALFFLVPVNNESVHVATDRTTMPAATEVTEPTTSEPDTTSNSTPTADTNVKPDPQSELVADDALASLVEPVEESASYVRFPSGSSNFPKDLPPPPAVVQDPHRLSSGEIQELFRQYIQRNPEVVALTSSEQYPVRRRPVAEATYTDGEHVEVPRPQYYVPAGFNHRNRDRNSEFWRPSSPWTEDTAQQKPLVLRFGATSSRFSPEHRYYEEQRQQQRQQEFSSPFGRTRRRGNLR